MSATDSEQISKGPRLGVEDILRQGTVLWPSALIGLTLVLLGLAGHAKDWPSFILPSLGWAILGAGVFLVSSIGILDRYAVIDIWQDRHSQTLQIQGRIEAYYNKGQEIYQRLGTDSTITTEDIHRLVADEWVQPVTEYLRGTLGDRKASYFLNVVRGSEPDEPSIRQLGYQKALARARIIDRLERLRQILGDLRAFS